MIGTGSEDAAKAAAICRQAPEVFSLAAALDPFTCHELGDGFDDALAQLANWLPSHNAIALVNLVLIITMICCQNHSKLNGTRTA